MSRLISKMLFITKKVLPVNFALRKRYSLWCDRAVLFHFCIPFIWVWGLAMLSARGFCLLKEGIDVVVLCAACSTVSR